MKTTITVSILIISLFVTSCAQALNDKFDDASGKLQAATGIENLDRMDGGGDFNEHTYVEVKSCYSLYWDDYTEIYLEAGKPKTFQVTISEGYCFQLWFSNSQDSDYVEYCSGNSVSASDATLTLSDNDGNSIPFYEYGWIYGSPETETYTYNVTFNPSTSGYVAVYCWQVPSLNYVSSVDNTESVYLSTDNPSRYGAISLNAGQYSLSFTSWGNVQYTSGLIIIYDVSDGSCVCLLSGLASQSQSTTFTINRTGQYIIGVQKLGSPVDDGFVGWSISTSN